MQVDIGQVAPVLPPPVPFDGAPFPAWFVVSLAIVTIFFIIAILWTLLHESKI